MRLAALLFMICVSVKAQPGEYNPIYRGEAGNVFSRQPNAFLVEMVRGRKPGKALDVGMGEGRNSIFLAQQGWTVTGFDTADEGVRRANSRAQRLGLKLSTVVTSFEQFNFGENQWDLIVLTYEPTKSIVPKIERALRPGGAVLIEDRHIDTRRVWPAGSFENNELISLFPTLRVLRYEDVWATPDWSAKGVKERLARESGCLWLGVPIAEGGMACWDTLALQCAGSGWQIVREKCRP
jgi:SAM-dependent methyltransferase